MSVIKEHSIHNKVFRVIFLLIKLFLVCSMKLSKSVVQVRSAKIDPCSEEYLVWPWQSTRVLSKPRTVPGLRLRILHWELLLISTSISLKYQIGLSRKQRCQATERSKLDPGIGGHSQTLTLRIYETGLWLLPLVFSCSPLRASASWVSNSHTYSLC